MDVCVTVRDRLAVFHDPRAIIRDSEDFMTTQFPLTSTQTRRGVRLAVGLLLVSLLVPAADALAQFGGIGGMSGSGSGGMGAGGGRRGAGMSGTQSGPSRQQPDRNLCTLGQVNADAVPYELVESRLNLLEADLKVGQGQEAAWREFASRVRAYAQLVERQHTAHGDGQPGGFAPPQVDGLKYLAQTVDRARDRYTLLEDTETAAKQLYKTLDKDQKTLIDMRLPSIVAPRFANPKCQQLGY